MRHLHRKVLGVAGLQHIDNGSEASMAGSCGLIKWCFSMTRFVSLNYMRDIAELLILTNNAEAVRALCATQTPMRILPLDLRLELLVESWKQMLNYSAAIAWSRTVSLHALYKLELFRLTEYQAILFTDVDVDPFLWSDGMPPTGPRGMELQRTWTTGRTPTG